MAMVFPDSTHVEVSDDEMGRNSIDDIATSWFVWLVAATASIAGSQQRSGYRSAASKEKDLITSLCSGGAFVGSIIAGLTADKVRLH